MPIILVDESILDTYHEIVVCPYKDAKVFCYEDIDKLIYEKANNKQLEKDFERLYASFGVKLPLEILPASLSVSLITLNTSVSAFLSKLSL